MANFNTHISVAFLASSVAVLIVYKAGMLSAPEFLLCTVVGTLGGLLPDIDLDHSVPAQVGFNVISLLVAFGMVVYWVGVLSVVTLMALWVLTYVSMRWGVFRLFNTLTSHRGIVHSVPYMFAVAMLVVYGCFYGLKYGAVFSWFLGLFTFFGSMVHLVLDEIYSVNVFGLKLKKSFGTALKFFSPSHTLWYAVLYGLIVIMLIFAPPRHVFWQNLTDPMTWLLLKKAFLPTGFVNV